MERTIDERVALAVDAWLRWLPRWRPGSHRGRTRLCRACFGSPLLAAAGIETDVPHAVGHGLSTRLKRIIDDAVDDYTRLNLPLLEAELNHAQAVNADCYVPEAGLDPEFDGLAVDPEPVPGEPFLFTLAELAERTAPEPLPPLSEAAKESLRREVALADDCARAVAARMIGSLAAHKPRIRAEITRFVEPQIASLLADLQNSLDSPSSPW